LRKEWHVVGGGRSESAQRSPHFRRARSDELELSAAGTAISSVHPLDVRSATMQSSGTRRPCAAAAIRSDDFHARTLSCAKFDGGMRTVAERLVVGLTTTAQCHAIAHLIFFAVRRNKRNSAPQPDWTTASFRRILDQSDRRLPFGFERSPGILVPHHQASRRAILDLSNERRAHFRIVSTRNLAPHLAVRVAESRERAQALDVEQCERRTVEYFRPIAV
jgi:hypothetical protein